MERFTSDTHSLVWFFTKSPNLSPAARECFVKSEREEALIIVPTIVLAETLYIKEKRKLIFDYDALIRTLRSSSNYVFYSFDFEVLRKLETLQRIPELHDRIITATALLTSSILITKDRLITESGVVETIW